MARVRRCHIASFESHMVVNTKTVERYLFINLFIIFMYMAERSQISILINITNLNGSIEKKTVFNNSVASVSRWLKSFKNHDVKLLNKFVCHLGRP